MLQTALSTALGGAGMSTPRSFVLGKVQASVAAIARRLFSNSEQGFAYDINDLSTLYQDAAGTTPVTAAGQPVGLVLDKSRGLQRGNELVVNGSFDVPDGWNSTGGFTIAGGKLLSTGTTNNNISRTDCPAVLGKVYEVTVNISSYTRGAPRVSFGGNIVDLPLKAGIYTYFTTAATNTSVLYIYSGYNAVGGVWEMDYISIKELKGNHAYQTTSASRPLLQRNATTGAYYLAFDGTDDYLVTSSIDFTSTDKVSLFAGVRKLSDVSTGIVLELSTNLNTNTGTFYLAAPPSSGSTRFGFVSKGVTAANIESGVLASPVSAVLSAFSDYAGSAIKLRANGVLTQNSSAQGGGKIGNYPLYIGRRGGASIPFNGHLYSLIGIARLTTDFETSQLEQALSKTVGVNF